MNQPARSPESGAGGRAAPLLGLAAGAAALVLLVAFFPGCGKPPTGGGQPDDKDRDAKKDPWKAAAARLKREPDAATCKLVFAALNNDLAADDSAAKPAGLPAEAEAALAALVPLSDEDRAEIRGAAFTAHDPVYAAECLYLRDAARSLEVPNAGPEELADLGFAWVCREVYLSPWLAPLTPITLRSVVIERVEENQRQYVTASALPPAYVLRRGYGSGLERMYVFLGLLRQMGLDGCLVGPPGAADSPAGLVALGPDKKTILTGTPRGPFWAVGVRVGGDVRLYDPWRGVAFPATLGQLRANPDAHKAWFEDKANVSGFTAADAKTAAVYLAVPVNALAPRMAAFDARVKAEVGARFAVDPAALRAAFPDPKPAFWNPPADRFAYGRTARTFLPVEEGGADRTERGPQRLYEAYIRQQLPTQAQLVPREVLQNPAVANDAAAKLVPFALGTYGKAFLLDPPTPRERFSRGQFQDAARDLVARQDEFARGLERLRNDRNADQRIREWVDEANRLYGAWGVALTNRDTNPDAVVAAKQALEAHWQADAVRLMVDRAISEVGLAEATYLLALCKHEQAERAQARLDRAAPPDAPAAKADALDAWAVALAEWRTYAGRAETQAAYPGRAVQVKALTARAEKLADQK